MIKNLTLFAIICCISSSFVLGNNPVKNQDNSIDKNYPIVLPWIKNSGQYNHKIAFATKTKVADIAVLKTGKINYFINTDQSEKLSFSESILNNNSIIFNIKGKDISSTKFNFIKNKNENINCFAYNTLDFGEIFKGIYLNIVAKGNNIEKIFHLEPFSNPKQINLKLNGVEDICENENGELQLEINGNTIAFTTPVAWQIINGNKIDIPVSYNIKENFVYGFNLGDYNPQFPLYIDPLLSSTFIGGSQMDIVNKIAISSTGKVYAGGITSSPDFPFTPGSFDETFNEAQDIFIAVFDSSLSTLEACTFVGGQGQDILTDMKLDDNDNVYFSGYTTSQDYPVTSLAYDTTFNNPGKPFTDIVISCLDSKLKEMKYSTFMGSELGDKAVAFDFDGSFNLIVTGISGGGIPIVGPQFFPDAKEFIIFKMDSQLKNLLATNSIQTDSLTIPVDLVAESSQSVFITGYTEDPNFPVTPNAFMDTLTGYSDVFVINLSNDLSVLNNSTFLGGKKYEAPTDIILDKDNNVLLAGNTKSKSFPVTTNAYDTIFANPDAGLDDIFICMLDFTLSEIKYSSFLGGNNQEILGQLAIDDTGNIFLSGSTNSKDFPMFCNSIDDVFNGTSDGFVVKFSPKLENLIGASFIGGDEDDYCLGLARDHAGNIYTAGFTTSIDFPVYNGFDNFYNGDSGDGFIMKMSADLQKPYPCCTQIFDPVPESIDNPRILNLKWEQSIGATGYLLSIGTTKDSFNLLYKYDLANQTSYIWDFDCGDDTVYVKISPYNDFGVNETCDTIWFVIRQPFENTEYISICEGDSVEWQGSYYSESGVYTESYMDIEGCDSTYTLNLNVYPNYYYGEDAEICNGDSYFWQGDFYTTAGDYYKNYNTINGCDSIFELQLTVLPSYLFEFDTTICQGDTVFWQNYSLTSGGYYTSEYQTIVGCDSIYQLNLIVLPSYYFEKEAGICEGDTFYWQGMALDSTGTYSVQYSTVENCDSNYLLNLSVFPSYSFEEAAEICSSDTFYWQGMYLNESGTYQVDYTTVNECDSSYQLILTVLPSYYFEEEAGICEGDTFYWQGMTLDSAGTYSVQYSTVENCDSNYLLNLSVLPSYSFEETAEICSADTFYWQGMALIESGTYQVDYTTVNECDSSYQLTLTVLPSYYFEEEASICEGDTFYWQGMILDSAGTYSAKYSTIENCDSIFKITLEEIILDDTISQSGDTLFAKYDSAASYQWVNCPGYDTITGANESTYITTESGQYAVIIEKDGCSKISECINVVNSGLVSHENENEVKIYPNPVKDNYIYIETGETTSDYIIIRDFTGKNVEKHITKSNITRINISNLSQGIYFISIFTGKKIINKKFVVIK